MPDLERALLRQAHGLRDEVAAEDGPDAHGRLAAVPS